MFLIFQAQAGILRAKLRGRQRDEEVRRADHGMQESVARYPRHRAPYKLRLQGHRAHPALRVPELAAAPLGESLRR